MAKKVYPMRSLNIFAKGMFFLQSGTPPVGRAGHIRKPGYPDRRQ